MFRAVIYPRVILLMADIVSKKSTHLSQSDDLQKEWGGG